MKQDYKSDGEGTIYYNPYEKPTYPIPDKRVGDSKERKEREEREKKDKDKLFRVFRRMTKLEVLIETLVYSRSPNCNKEKLREWSEHDNQGVRCNVASNHNTSIDVLKKLSKDRLVAVRYAVATNLKTPQSVLEDMIYDNSPTVKNGLLLNPNCPEHAKVLINL